MRFDNPELRDPLRLALSSAGSSLRVLSHPLAAARAPRRSASVRSAGVSRRGSTSPSMRRLNPAERTDAERRGAELAASGWLNTRKLDPALDKASRSGSQLGFIEAHLKLAGGAAIERITLSGDFITNSPGLARFERELVGMPLDLASVSGCRDASLRRRLELHPRGGRAG